MLSIEKTKKTVFEEDGDIDPEQDKERYPDAFGAEEKMEDEPDFDARKGESVFGMPESKRTDITNPLRELTDEEIDELAEAPFKKQENN
jgi:hypothetical protein